MENLDLFNCKITRWEDNRQRVFEQHQTTKLDGLDGQEEEEVRDGAEEEEDEASPPEGAEEKREKEEEEEKAGWERGKGDEKAVASHLLKGATGWRRGWWLAEAGGREEGFWGERKWETKDGEEGLDHVRQAPKTLGVQKSGHNFLCLHVR